MNRIPVAKLVYTEEYIDGSHTVLFRDGRFVIFTQDTLSGYRVYIDSMDMETGTLSEDGGIIVQCDYNLKPMYAVRQDICYFFYDYKYGWNENREGPQSMSLSGLTPGTKYNYCTRMTVPIIIPELGPAETDLRGNDRSFTTLCDDISPDI